MQKSIEQIRVHKRRSKRPPKSCRAKNNERLICVQKLSLLKTKTSNGPLPQWYLYFLIFLCSKDICICLVGQIGFYLWEICVKCRHSRGVIAMQFVCSFLLKIV